MVQLWLGYGVKWYVTHGVADIDLNRMHNKDEVQLWFLHKNFVVSHYLVSDIEIIGVCCVYMYIF